MRIQSKNVSMLALILFSQWVSVASGWAQGSGSHGGDGLVFEFTGTALNLSKKLSELPPIAECPSAEAFRAAVSTDAALSGHTSVRSEVFDSSLESMDAIVIPGLIRLNRAKLVRRIDPQAYVALVLDQYLEAMGLKTSSNRTQAVACLSAMEKTTGGSMQFADLIYRYMGTTDFEEQFAFGQAGLRCFPNGDARRTEYILFVNSRGVSVPSLSVARKEDFGNYRVFALTHPSESDATLNRFKAEYSVLQGESHFSAEYAGSSSRYILKSDDHVLWQIEAKQAIKVDGEFKKVRDCKPVYFRLPYWMMFNLR